MTTKLYNNVNIKKRYPFHLIKLSLWPSIIFFVILAFLANFVCYLYNISLINNVSPYLIICAVWLPFINIIVSLIFICLIPANKTENFNAKKKLWIEKKASARFLNIVVFLYKHGFIIFNIIILGFIVLYHIQYDFEIVYTTNGVLIYSLILIVTIFCPYFIFMWAYNLLSDKKRLQNITQIHVIELLFGFIIIFFCWALNIFFIITLLYASLYFDFKNTDITLGLLNNLIIELPEIKIYKKIDYKTAYNYVLNFFDPDIRFSRVPNTYNIAKQKIMEFGAEYSKCPTDFGNINIKLNTALNELDSLAYTELKNLSKPKSGVMVIIEWLTPDITKTSIYKYIFEYDNKPGAPWRTRR